MNKPHHILIVDDDPDIVANLSDILADVGYATETATDGQTALECVDRKCDGGKCEFDLCLMDFKMPGMDGAELLRKLRSRNPELKAIMITAYAGDDGVQRALAAGTWKVMRKPVDVNLLLAMIEEAIQSD